MDDGANSSLSIRKPAVNKTITSAVAESISVIRSFLLFVAAIPAAMAQEKLMNELRYAIPRSPIPVPLAIRAERRSITGAHRIHAAKALSRKLPSGKSSLFMDNKNNTPG